MADPLRFFTEVAHECGDVARIGIGKFKLYLVSSPDLIGHVLHGNAKNYWKGKGLAAAGVVMGQGLATSEGDLWERQHRLIQPAFRAPQLATYLPFVQHATREVLEGWRPRSRQGEAFDAAEDMRRLALRVICRILFRSDLDPAAHESVSRGVALANEKINRSAWTLLPFLDSFPTPFNVRFRRALAELDGTVYRKIREQRGSPRTGEGLLDQLIGSANGNSRSDMADRQIRDEIVTIFIAGVDTPAHALAWTIHLLARHPDWAERVAGEADEVLSGDALSWEAVERLDIAERVFKESMRLFPPAWVIVRTPLEDDVLGGYSIPASSPILMSQYVVHRHPAHWDRPETFDPDRWRPENSAARHRFAYFPFGGGSRFCIAQGLGILLGKVVIAMAAKEYRWKEAGSRPALPQPLTTLRPKYGISIRAEERERGPHRLDRSHEQGTQREAAVRP